MLQQLSFQISISKDLTSGVIYKFHSGLCNEFYYGACLRDFSVRIGEHIGILPLTKKQTKPKNCSIVNHLLIRNHSASFENFNILMHENKRFL